MSPGRHHRPGDDRTACNPSQAEGDTLYISEAAGGYTKWSTYDLRYFRASCGCETFTQSFMGAVQSKRLPSRCERRKRLTTPGVARLKAAASAG